MKTIIWDVDDVLNDLMHAWFTQEWLPAHPGCTVRYRQLTANPPHAVLHVPLEDYLASLDKFRDARGPDLLPNPHVRAWFISNGHAFRHAALTAVPYRVADVWAGWVIKHFGHWIRSFNFVPSARPGDAFPAYDTNKRDFMAWLGTGDILVDDSPAHLAAAKSLGKIPLAFPRPWNNATHSVPDLLQTLSNLAT